MGKVSILIDPLDLFIISGRDIKEMASAWDEGDTSRFYSALDQCRQQPIDGEMNHVCSLHYDTTPSRPNEYANIRLLKFHPIVSPQFKKS